MTSDSSSPQVTGSSFLLSRGHCFVQTCSICNYCIPPSAGFPATDLRSSPTQLKLHPPVRFPSAHRTKAKFLLRVCQVLCDPIHVVKLASLTLLPNSRVPGHSALCFPSCTAPLTGFFPQECLTPHISKGSV
uniref:Uncharacterized protein n=1 Tax=Molossus molossus TaxID=27622 RepID=A0A7J8F9I3_MOLMO|nr:hypothetical protein HJG59_008584 [Molossus molossus]